MNKKDILDQFKDRKKISEHGLRAQWTHIDECRAFYAGDYQKYRARVRDDRTGKLQEVQFNRVKPYVNAVVGFFAQHRRKPDYQAVVMDNEERMMFTDYINGYSDHLREQANAPQKETRQDLDMTIGGVGATDTGITLKAGTPTRMPSGEVIMERVDPKTVGWDPAAIEGNVTDSRWVYRVKDYDIEEAEDLFGVEEEDLEIADSTSDNNYTYINGGIKDREGYEYSDATRRMARVYFYQWYEIENFYRIENPLLSINSPQLAASLYEAFGSIENGEEEIFKFDPTAQTLVVTKDNRKDVKEIFDAFDLSFNAIKEKRKCYYTAIISGDRVFDYYKSVSQQGFSLKFKTGDRDDVNNIWTGIVASMRDPQRYYNKSLTELMVIIASNSRGGVMYEENAVSNVQKFEAQYAKTGGSVMVNDGAISGAKIRAKAEPYTPSGYENILQESANSLSDVTGIDESFFGVISGGNETAMLQRQRIKQATTTLAIYFDSIELYAKEQARLMLSYMRMLSESSRGEFFMVYDNKTGQEIYEQVSPEYFANEYYVKIGEAPETPMQQEYIIQTLTGMAQSMQAIGDPTYKGLYAMAVEKMPLTYREKKQIRDILSGEQIDPMMVQQLQARLEQMESQQMQLQGAKMMEDIKKAAAETQKTAAEIEKIKADIAEKLEDTEGKAIENDIMALKSPQEVDATI